MKVLTAGTLGIWIICGGAIGVQADNGAATRDTVAAETSVATMPDSTSIESTAPLAGRWRASETTDEEKQRLEAIDEVTDHLGLFKRGRGRSRLKELTSPPPSLMIGVTGSKVTMDSGDRRLELELGGPPIEITGSQGTTRMSAKLDGQRLVVLARGDKGERTASYRASGDELTMRVVMTGDQLDGPLEYVTTYARME